MRFKHGVTIDSYKSPKATVLFYVLLFLGILTLLINTHSEKALADVLYNLDQNTKPATTQTTVTDPEYFVADDTGTIDDTSTVDNDKENNVDGSTSPEGTSTIQTTETVEYTQYTSMVTTDSAQETETVAKLPALLTDKEDYLPGETVTIDGINFNPLQSYALSIIAKNGMEVLQTLLTADEKGSLKATYLVPTDGTSSTFYTIEVKDSESTIMAVTTFLDSPGNIYFITPDIIIEPSTPTDRGDADGEPPADINAYVDPSKAIIGIKLLINPSTVLHDTTVTIEYNGWGGNRIFIDGDNIRHVGDLSAGEHYYYWSLEKNQLEASNPTIEGFTVKVQYDGGSFKSNYTVRQCGLAEVGKNGFDWLETYQSSTNGNIGDSYFVTVAYSGPLFDVLKQIAAQLYNKGDLSRLTNVSIYYYDETEYIEGSLIESANSPGGVPGGWTSQFLGTPYLGYGQTPATANSNDFWVVKYDFEVLGQANYLLVPYLQTYSNTIDSHTQAVLNVDSGYIEFKEGPIRVFGFTYNDINENGLQDDGESVLDGITIELVDSDDNVLKTVVSNSIGYFEFTNLFPGTYKLRAASNGSYYSLIQPSVLTLLSGEQCFVRQGVRTVPDPTITKQGPTEAAPSDTLTYTVTVTNNGSGNAYNVTVTDTLPDGTTATQTIGTLNPGESKEVTFSYQVPSDAADNTTLTNTASVTCTDKETGGNQYLAGSNEVVTTVKASVKTSGGSTTTSSKSTVSQTPNYELLFEKSVDKSSAKAGDTLVYSIHFENAGNATIHNIVITDTIPENCSYIMESATSSGKLSKDGKRITWNIKELGSGEEGTVVFKVRIADTADNVPDIDESLIINNTAAIAADELSQSKNASAVTEILREQNGIAVRGEQEENPDQSLEQVQEIEAQQDAAVGDNSKEKSSVSSVPSRDELPYTGGPLQIFLLVIGCLMFGLGVIFRIRYR